MYSLILQDFHLLDSEVINVYPFGSRVYGTNTESSDYDFVVIANKEIRDFDLVSNDGKINIHLYPPQVWEEQLLQHKIVSMECIFVPQQFMLKNTRSFTFKLNKEILRSSISEKASNSWVKAKKKLEAEKDRNIYIAKKSLFHSLRIIEFGKQIAQFSKITDYGVISHLWNEIRSNPAEDWNTYKDKYQEYFNHQMTEFRKLAPK